MNQNSFFSEESVKALIKRLQEHDYKSSLERNNLILDLIRAKAPISKYEIAKLSGLSYPTIKQITKEFVFVGLVYERIATGSNGMPVKLISIFKEGDNETD